ncbi:MAG: PhoX family phosphatase [Alphaproteobacteria bacterium]|nr:PhoX family phosphatase [Alphaproteobacteria bacterium]
MIGRNPEAQTLAAMIAARTDRREAMLGLAAVMAGSAAGVATLATAGAAESLGFAELTKGYDETHHVADGYGAQVLLRWGDPVAAGAPAFDPAIVSPEAQEAQFGFNCDFIAFLPLPAGSTASDRGRLVVNHEYSDPVRMFPGVNPENIGASLTRDHVGVELAAVGLSVAEIRRDGAAWSVVADSTYNRRVSLRSTVVAVAGPAKGHARMRTIADASGERVIGTLSNCGGGVTPWGTILSAEENFHQYLSGDPAGTLEAVNYDCVGIKGEPDYPWWALHEARFDLSVEPNEPNRFGWVVEIDPYDPAAQPVKRTALGRFKHEAATTVVNGDGRVVVYSGDDERFEYLYKFVTAGVFAPGDRAANADLLDDGTLFVARLAEDGSVAWLPLVYGEGPLTQASGFSGQADVVIEARRAADLLGATPMDRPEDVETNPVTGKVYVILTNNTKRKADQVDAANPRAENTFGHILELTPPDGDHAAAAATWDIFLLAGDPAAVTHGAKYGPGVTADGWIAAPDNCAFDNTGRLWIATDGAPKSAGHADGVFACAVAGAGRALTRRFFSAPRGAEVCGPCFTPDGTTLFLAVQHPGEEDGSTFATPSTRWPDFADGTPPRPAVVAIVKAGGGLIGT